MQYLIIVSLCLGWIGSSSLVDSQESSSLPAAAVWDGGESHIFGIRYGPLLGEVDHYAEQHLDKLDLVLHGGEPVGPEGRVDGPVVPGGEEGGPHVVDQVNNFYLQEL